MDFPSLLLLILSMGKIVFVKAIKSENDKASHAFKDKGKKTTIGPLLEVACLFCV
jgi:hypothetical protein